MRIRLTQLSLALVTTLFCTVSFSATPMDTGSATQGPLLLADKSDKVEVCHVKPNDKYKTQEVPEDTADKLIDEHPHEWLLGPCENHFSPA